jgi:putative peptide zinc metalloprotease protein
MTVTAAAPADTRAGTGPASPRLADGVELIGEYEGSGYKEPPALVRRGDGQVIQLTPLLYAVAEQADGTHGYTEMAERVGASIGRKVSADNVRFLVEERLAPLGIVTGPDGSQPDVEKSDPLLALKFRAAVIPEWLANSLGRVFMPLFHAPIVIAVLAGLVVADIWLFFEHGVAQAIRQSVYHPGLFLPLFAAVVLSAAFHEVGHAAACRFGGAKPGRMGCGLYLAWPAFYTDVTDAYRLGRRARLRTDLGGVYFNTIVVLLTVGAYLATGFEPLLLLVLIEHFEIVHQLLPIVRLDGYYIVADLTGVPDLFNRIGPIMRGLLPWRRPDERVLVLKRWVRVAVTAWVLIVVPLLFFQLLMVLIHLPRIVGTALDSAGKQWHASAHAFGSGKAVAGATGVLEILVLAVPIIGILLMLVRVFHRGGVWTWQHTQGKPVLRLSALAVAGGLAALLAMAWLPTHNYKPIRPGEKGTMADGVAAVEQLPTGHGPLASRERAAQAGTLGTTGSPDQSGTSTTLDPAGAATTDSTTSTTGTTTGSTSTGGSTDSTTSTTVSSTTTTSAASDTTTTAAP